MYEVVSELTTIKCVLYLKLLLCYTDSDWC